MLVAELFWGLLAAVLLADLLRIRNRLTSIPTLRPDESEPAPDLVVVAAPGINVPVPVVESAIAHMKANELRGLELIPGQLSLATAWSMGCHIDREAHRTQVSRPGETAVHAFIAPADVLDQLGVEEARNSLASFASVAREVRRRLGDAHDLAIAPGLVAAKQNPFFDAGVLEVKLVDSIFPVLVGVPFTVGLIVMGPLVAPWMGTVTLLLHALQQAVAVRDTGLQIRLPFLQGLLRIPVDVLQWLQLIRSMGSATAKIEALRPVYTALLADGVERFFMPPVDTCPVCGEGTFGQRFTLPDLFQSKPGRFQLMQCNQCRSWVQNPQLSPEGLAFYYKDAYDGLGERSLDALFGANQALYEQRVDMVCGHIEPKRWLDVGCGHGHMFSRARTMLHDTRLEGLDFGSAVSVGKARGWMDEAHEGLFVDHAADLAGRFDVVSMCHYLEHVTDQRAEMRAAHTALSTGGLLLIEVPDPESVFMRLLGRHWMPWYQPQHLHLVPTVQLAEMLRECGFEPVEWHTGSAHSPNDFLLASVVWLRRFSPNLDVPWRDPPSILARLRHGLIWTFGVPLVIAGALADKLLAPLAKRAHHVSQYRVIARRV